MIHRTGLLAGGGRENVGGVSVVAARGVDGEEATTTAKPAMRRRGSNTVKRERQADGLRREPPENEGSNDKWKLTRVPRRSARETDDAAQVPARFKPLLLGCRKAAARVSCGRRKKN